MWSSLDYSECTEGSDEKHLRRFAAIAVQCAANKPALSGGMRISEEDADCASITYGFEVADELAKACGEKLAPNGPILGDTRGGDVMPKEFLPAKPELFVHQSIKVVKVNRLERLQKLMAGVKEARLLFHRQGL